MYNADEINRMGPAERIRAHVQFHDTVLLDCRPGACPFRDRRETLERRNVFTRLGIFRMMWYVIRRNDRRQWKERRTRDVTRSRPGPNRGRIPGG